MGRKSKFLAGKQSVGSSLRSYKVRLDERTVITLSKPEALAFWKQRYPQAKVID